LEYSENVLLVITFVGALTVVFSSITGYGQFDIKKIIAYSTCSQLGYMVYVCGNSQYLLAVNHLFNHAFFKALLFLGAGSVIHGMSGDQDIRRMGGLRKLLPITYITFMIASLSLMGSPFLTGFYSKDIIIEVGDQFLLSSKNMSVYLTTLSVFSTAFYSIRLIYYVFFSTPAFMVRVVSIQETGPFTIIVLVSLSLLSIFAGYLVQEVFSIEIQSNWYLSGNEDEVYYEDEDFVDKLITLLPLIFTVIGIGCGMLACKFIDWLYMYIELGLQFVSAKWFFDLLINNCLVLAILNCAREITFKLLDRGLFEKVGSLSTSNIFRHLSKIYSNYQTGFIFHWIALGLLFLGSLVLISLAKVMFPVAICMLGCLLIISYII